MHQALEAFSDRCAFNDNVLTRLDARVKLFLALAAVIATLRCHSLLFALAVFVFCIGAMLAVRMGGRTMLLRLAGPMGMAAVLCVLQAALSGSAESMVLWRGSLGSWVITVTREGLDRGLFTGARVLGSVSVLILLGTVTPAFKVFAALGWARMPATMVDLSMLMYRYIFGLLERLVQVHSAQRVRLGYVGAGRSLSSMGALMGAMTLGALDQAGRTHEAMLVRLYDPRAGLPMAELGPISGGQWAVLAGGVAALAGAFALCQWGPI